MKRSSKLAVLLSLLAAVPVPAGLGQDAGDDPLGGAAGEPVRLRVVTDRAEVRPGATFRVAVVLEIAPGWHAYANPKGPGIGKAAEVTGVDREGFRFGPARYLPGTRKSQEDIAPGDWVYAYEGETPVFLEVTAAQDVAPGSYSLSVVADLLVCRESCVPLEETLSFDVAVAAGEGEPASREGALFARFDEAAPAAAASGEPAETEPGKPFEFDEGIDISRYSARSLGGGAVTGLLAAILFGFVAGMLLNVMPCVLPVLSIKVISLINQAHEERGRVFRLGLAFGAGIMAVFLVLASLAAGAVAAGESAGWGDHFRSQSFLVAMIGVVFVFALGLFDVYIILVAGGGGGGGTREGYTDSFFKGVLTTFLATPCSGPFLGAVLAWALSQRPLTIFAVFSSIGLGMALPYVVLSASPGLMRFVPKPGPWMETFKNLMGFLLLGTVVYLFSILRDDLVVPTLALCVVLGLGAYLWGRFAHGGVPLVMRWARRAGIAALVALGAFACYAQGGESEALSWEPFSLAKMEECEIEGRTVVVDFTADWCPNCKFVEKFVLESDDVEEALAAKGAALLKADLTRASKDDPAQRLLDQLGSRSIPFLSIHPGDDHFRPYILRDVYSRASVLDILGRCPDA